MTNEFDGWGPMRLIYGTAPYESEEIGDLTSSRGTTVLDAQINWAVWKTLTGAPCGPGYVSDKDIHAINAAFWSYLNEGIAYPEPTAPAIEEP